MGACAGGALARCSVAGGLAARVDVCDSSPVAGEVGAGAVAAVDVVTGAGAGGVAAVVSVAGAGVLNCAAGGAAADGAAGGALAACAAGFGEFSSGVFATVDVVAGAGCAAAGGAAVDWAAGAGSSVAWSGPSCAKTGAAIVTVATVNSLIATVSVSDFKRMMALLAKGRYSRGRLSPELNLKGRGRQSRNSPKLHGVAPR
jgi:hypothetical protein